jgi:putative ABC transport system permease protein
MRPAWRLATSSVFERPSRTILLIAVVALSALLIAAVGVAMGSVRGAIDRRVEDIVGKAEVRVRPKSRGTWIDAEIQRKVEANPAVLATNARVSDTLAVRFAMPTWTQTPGGPWTRADLMMGSSAAAEGYDPVTTPAFRQIRLVQGRLPAASDEIVLDEALARRLSEHDPSKGVGASALAALAFTGKSGEPMKAGDLPPIVDDAAKAAALNKSSRVAVGDSVEIVRLLKPPIRLRVVGISAQPTLGGRPGAFLISSTLAEIAGQAGKSGEIDIKLKPGVIAEQFAKDLQEQVGKDLVVQTTERITSGLNRNLRSNQLGFVIATMMSFIAAGFIIMTGMSVSVTERQRELAILRCIGATRAQLAQAQIFVGVIIGGIGGLIGVPVGVAAAAFMIHFFREKIGADVVVEPWRVAIALAGSVFCGIVGASYASWAAARVSPLSALASRAKPPRQRTRLILLIVGLLGIATHLAVFLLIRDSSTLFWSYIGLGLPGLMMGYFVMGVPAVLLAARLLAPAIGRLFSLPPTLLRRTIQATPYRFGFTAGAMMSGLALMVAIWTQGGSAVRDWLGKIDFPDAFVVGVNLTAASQNELRQLPFVKQTCAVSLYPVETEVFGIKRLTRFKSFFVAFEPREFFDMARVTWVQGDPEYAIRRLEEGGAVIVAREFLNAKGLGVGGTFVCWDKEKEFKFEIVGVVTTPGLEMVSKFFDVGDEFTDQSMHAVFGSHADLKNLFGSESIGLIQMTLDPSVSDEDAIRTIRERLFSSGIVDAGSGRQVKREISRFVNNTLLVSSIVAVFAMIVACFGVANLIVAGVQARQFEFGVLRAVGAQNRTLVRLVLAEALIVAIAACVLGTLMGVQGAWGGVTMNRTLWGLDIGLALPWLQIAAGWAFVIFVTMAAAAPAVIGLGRKAPRELLASVRG